MFEFFNFLIRSQKDQNGCLRQNPKSSAFMFFSYFLRLLGRFLDLWVSNGHIAGSSSRVAGAVAPDATRTDPNEIADYIDSLSPQSEQTSARRELSIGFHSPSRSTLKPKHGKRSLKGERCGASDPQFQSADTPIAASGIKDQVLIKVELISTANRLSQTESNAVNPCYHSMHNLIDQVSCLR